MSLLIDTSRLTEWRKARKTKPVLARPLESLINDSDIAAHLILRTLEGNQDLKEESIVCIGAGNDAWQQSSTALLKKYDLTGFKKGWMIMTPKSENEVLATQILEPEFEIYAKWGTKDADGRYRLSGVSGAYVLHNPEDAEDYWIVAEKLFENTYEFIAAPVHHDRFAGGAIRHEEKH